MQNIAQHQKETKMNKIKEFEENKKFIIDELNSIYPSIELKIQYAIYNITELKPPKPKCIDCNYLDKKEYFEYFSGPVKQIAYSCNYNYFQIDNIEDPESWGCTDHSHYYDL